MKKLIFILIILLSTKSFSQDRRICERDYVNTALTEMNLGIIGIVIRDKVYPKNDNFVMQAHVEEHNGQYLIGIDKYTNQHKRKALIAHELIHIKQYEEGRIKVIDSHTVLFEGIKYDINKISHTNRPWEREARLKSKPLHKEIIKSLKTNERTK